MPDLLMRSVLSGVRGPTPTGHFQFGAARIKSGVRQSELDRVHVIFPFTEKACGTDANADTPALQAN
jgi:hypothetical protein